MSLAEIDKRIQGLYEEWSSLQPLSPEDGERLWEKIRLEWNYNSNRIEGNTLTYSETELLLIHGRTEGGHPIRDYEEMKAHNVGVKKVREFAEDKEYCLTEADIRSLNLIILKEPFWKEAETPDGQPTRKQIFPGQYKNQPNHVRTATGEIFKFALPEETPAKMRELMEWFRENIESHPASIVSFLAELHHRFIFIHPFDDGNGRIVRLWINYALMRFGYPPVVIKSEDREGYIAAIQKADTGNIEALAVYLGKSLISWLETGIKAARGEDISEPRDVDKEVDIFIKSEKAKGLRNARSLSREYMEEICEQSWIPLFETFENRFRQFNEMFVSTKTTFLLSLNHSSGKPASLEGLKKRLKKLLEEQETRFTEGLQISFEGYKTGLKSFDMKVELLIERRPYDFEYKISIRTDPYDTSLMVFKTIPSARAWTNSEIMEFVSEIKKSFLGILMKIKEKAAEGEEW